MTYSMLSYFILFLPLISFLINGVFYRCFTRRIIALFAILPITGAAVLSTYVFYHIYSTGSVVHLILLKWLCIDDVCVNWSIYIDQLTSLMFIVVTYVSCMVHIYSIGYMHSDESIGKFLAFISLFTFFMLLLLASDNFIQLFCGWEGVGLCSYLLIGYWYKDPNANAASFKAFIVNRVGDFGLLLGIVIIVLNCKSAAFYDVFKLGNVLQYQLYDLGTIRISILDIICLLLVLGCVGKSAQIGMHIWLPDAMEGPTPVSALIHAATMVTAGIFLIARCSYIFEYSVLSLKFISLIGAVTCLFGALVAIFQTDIKKIIAYSTCSQLGYMFLACGVSAYNAAIFHLFTHAFFKALLFLSAGNVIHAIHKQDVNEMGNLRCKMPLTYMYFCIGSLSLIGIFPFSGFYSKDFILHNAYSDFGLGHYLFVVGIVSIICTAIYSAKILVLVFYGSTKLLQSEFDSVHDAPFVMQLPLSFLALSAIVAGLFGHYVLDIEAQHGYFKNSLFFMPKNGTNHISDFMSLLPLVSGIVGLFIGILLYRMQKDIKHKILLCTKQIFYNALYFDSVYFAVFVSPIKYLARILYALDKKVVDNFGVGSISNSIVFVSRVVSGIQTGRVYNYTNYIVFCVTSGISFLILKHCIFNA